MQRLTKRKHRWNWIKSRRWSAEWIDKVTTANWSVWYDVTMFYDQFQRWSLLMRMPHWRLKLFLWPSSEISHLQPRWIPLFYSRNGGAFKRMNRDVHESSFMILKSDQRRFLYDGCWMMVLLMNLLLFTAKNAVFFFISNSKLLYSASRSPSPLIFLSLSLDKW